MAHTYERSGKPKLPGWWTERVFPILERSDVDFGELAAKASRFAGRASPWKRDAISKFKNGVAQTRELANGISLALGVPPPYFEARSEKEAKAIQALLEATGPSAITADQQGKLVVLDQASEAERRSAIDQTRGVPSNNEGTPRRGGIGRTARRRS